MSNTKKYAILYLYEHQKKSVAEISKELKIAETEVQQIVSSPTETKPKKEDKTKNLMIRQTAGKKTNSVSIMTHAASQVSDEFIKKNNPTTRDTSSFIFKPREN